MNSTPKINSKPDKEEKISSMPVATHAAAMEAVTIQAALIASAIPSEPVYDHAYAEKIYQELAALPDAISSVVNDNSHYGATIHLKSNLITSSDITTTYLRYGAEDDHYHWTLKHDFNSAQLVDFRIPETVCVIDTNGIGVVYSSVIRNDVLIATKNLPSAEQKNAAEQHNKLVLSHLHHRASQNDANALYKLGLIYGNGVEIAEDDQFAFSCYLKAAKQNHAYAIWKVGKYCLYGYGGWGYLPEMGIKFWSLAAKRGCIPAGKVKDCVSYVVIIQGRPKVFLVKRSLRSEPDGADIIDISKYKDERLISISLNESDYRILEMSCIGINVVPDNLAVIYKGNDATEKLAVKAHNERVIAKQYQKVKSNNPYEQYILGCYLTYVMNMPEKAVAWFEKSARQNYPRALWLLSLHSFHHSRNLKFLYYSNKAISQGHQRAKDILLSVLPTAPNLVASYLKSVYRHARENCNTGSAKFMDQKAIEYAPDIWIKKIKIVCGIWKESAELLNNKAIANIFSAWLGMAELGHFASLLKELTATLDAQAPAASPLSFTSAQTNSLAVTSAASSCSNSSSVSIQPRNRPTNLRPLPTRKRNFPLLEGTASFQFHMTNSKDKKQKVSSAAPITNVLSISPTSANSIAASSSNSSSGMFSQSRSISPATPTKSAASSIDAKKDAMIVKQEQEFLAANSPVITENDLRAVTDFLRGDSKSKYNCARFAIDIKEYQKTGKKPTQRTNPMPGTFRQSTLSHPTQPIKIKNENDEVIVSNEIVQMRVFQTSELFEDAIPQAVFYESSKGGIYVEGIDLVDDEQALVGECGNYKTINHAIQHLANVENKILVGTLILVFHEAPEANDTSASRFAKRYGVHFVPFRAIPNQRTPLYMDCMLEDKTKRVFSDLSEIYTFIDSKNADLANCFIKTCSFVLHAKFSLAVVDEQQTAASSSSRSFVPH